MDCEKLNTCAFFKLYEERESNKLAISGFVRMYCKGNMQNDCLRKKVSKALGGPEKVPVNMMPNSIPLPGTDSSEWPTGVKALL